VTAAATVVKFANSREGELVVSRSREGCWAVSLAWDWDDSLKTLPVAVRSAMGRGESLEEACAAIVPEIDQQEPT